MQWFLSLQTKQKAVLALILANTIWGAASPIFKWSLENINLFTLAFFRFFGASLLLLPFVIKRDLKVKKSDILPLICMAFLGITLNITFFFWGLKLSPSINAPIIASSGPILLIIASLVFLREKAKAKTLWGTLISLVGVFIIIARPLFEKGFDITAVEGNLFFLLATVGAVGHALFAKKLSASYSALPITFWSFIIGTISFFPFFLWETNTIGFTPLDIRGITGLIFGIVLSSTAGYVLYQWAMQHILASETGVFTYIDPVIATVIAIPLLGEMITPLFILGSFFVFVGIFVAEGRLHYHPFHRLRS